MHRLLIVGAFFAALLCSGCSWSGLGTSDNSEPQTFDLTLNVGANGTVTVSDSPPYKRNQIITLTANPDANFQVGSWSGTMDDSVASLINYVRMDGNKTVSVNFVPAITLSGNVTFTSVPAVSGVGLDYEAASDVALRGAVIQVIDQNTSVLYAQGNLDASGAYLLSVPSNTDIRIIVQAALGTPTDPHVVVVDNTDGQSLYSMFLDITTAAVDTSGVDFNADSGWDGSDYNGPRTAGPFAILDVIYQAEQMVLAVDATATFPDLTVNWSENNTNIAGDISAGEIGTSFYEPSSSSLYILGAEDVDTDEYDQAIIAHEWTHYFEHQFSRTDSIGGPHADGDVLDPTVALSEGLATALSGIIRGTDEYIDTIGTDQAVIGLELDLEADAVSGAATFPGDSRPLDGYWSENSVAEVLYDIMDSADDGSDDISLGFDALYDAMTNDYKTTSAFTTVLTLLYHIDQLNGPSSASIHAIANDENIDIGDEFETGDVSVGMRIYTPLTLETEQTDDVDGNTLATDETYGSMASFPDNKLLNRRFFNLSALAAGDYEITVTPVTSSQSVILHLNDRSSFTTGGSGAMLVPYTHSAAGDFSFAAGTINAAGDFTVEINAVPTTVVAPLTAPVGNG